MHTVSISLYSCSSAYVSSSKNFFLGKMLWLKFCINVFSSYETVLQLFSCRYVWSAWITSIMSNLQIKSNGSLFRIMWTNVFRPTSELLSAPCFSRGLAQTYFLKRGKDESKLINVGCNRPSNWRLICTFNHHEFTAMSALVSWPLGNNKNVGYFVERTLNYVLT